MGDYKGKYSVSAAKAIQLSETSKALEKIKADSKKRRITYGDSWEKVDINEIVEKFTPGAIPYQINGKLIYSNGKYQIVTDLFGGYLRIIDKTVVSRGRNDKYITLDGTPYKDLKLSKDEKQRLTHFYILKRKDMK